MLFRRKIITTAIRPMKMIGSQMTAQSSKPERNEPSETTEVLSTAQATG
jgi:hypothetical protein